MIHSNKPYKRAERYGDEIRHLLAELLISEVYISEAGLVTVLDVKVTEDLHEAKVFVSFLGNKAPIENVMEIFAEKKSQIRYHLGNKLKSKYVPELKFYYDNTLEKAENIEHIIDKLHEND